MEEDRTQYKEDIDHINLIDLLIVLAKHKKMIICITMGAAVVTALISLILPPIYKAETKIYIPQTPASNFSAQLLNQIIPVASLVGGVQTPNQLYIELLKSRPVRDRIIDRFGLMKLYESETRDDANESLLDYVDAREDPKSGIIIFGIEDRDPQRSAAMANAFVEEFRKLKKNLSLTDASQRRLFFEEQVRDAKNSLTKAEEDMKLFQERTGALKIDAQASAVIEGIAQIRAQIAAKEVELKVMRTYSTSQNPDIKRAEEELQGMREQAQRLESKSSGDSVIVPTGNIPSASTEYARKMRELKFSETLYELLQSQYQSAKLDEAQDAMVVQIIEKAIPPEKKEKPRRMIMVILAMTAGLFIAVLAAFFLQYRENATCDPEIKQRMEHLRKYMSFRKRSLEAKKNME